jgi:DNA processing protein
MAMNTDPDQNDKNDQTDPFDQTDEEQKPTPPETKLVWIKDVTSKLRELHNPPAFLYAKGDIGLINPNYASGAPTYICIVGARSHTEYGRYVTREILKALRGQEIVVISGLATGIDTVAMETALLFNMPVIGVLGSGLDDSSVYPADNVSLVHRIIAAGGLVLSEYDDATKATKWAFPLRNRIMAGLSDAIVVIEGTSRSGTLITARLGLEFGRDIIAVPGPITSPLSQGPLSLIEAGATPLTHPGHILDILGLESPLMILREQTARENAYERTSPEERRVMECIASEPLDRDEIMARTDFPIHKLQIILTMLEIKNLIIERNGKIMRL